MSSYHHILVPLDDSALSERVVQTAMQTAAWSGADVILLRVQDAPASLEPGEAKVDLDVIEREGAELVARARAMVPAGSQVAVKVEVRSGDVVEAIVGAVADLQIDLVVMGMHGREGLIETLFGSTTEQTLRKVPASLFVVRPVGFPYLTD